MQKQEATIIDRFASMLTGPMRFVLDRLAELVYDELSEDPDYRKLSDNERWALAYAIVGDTLVSLIPEPLDAPMDEYIQYKIRSYLPDLPRDVAVIEETLEDIDVAELLPNYYLMVMYAIRKRHENKYTEKRANR